MIYKLTGTNFGIFLLFFPFFFISVAGISQNYELQRKEMVAKQIRSRGVNDPKVLDALRTIPRHMFVPDEYKNFAYEDRPLPIGHGQTISQPYIVGLMTDLLDLNPDDKVLEVGTGSGYQAAVLAHLVNNVYSIEIVEPLAESAQQVFTRLEYQNIHTKVGDGYKGWPDKSPFDAIIVTCSPSHIPQPLIDQLAEGGKIIIPVGERFTQELVLATKKNGKLRKKDVIPVRFVPMKDPAGENY